MKRCEPCPAPRGSSLYGRCCGSVAPAPRHILLQNIPWVSPGETFRLNPLYLFIYFFNFISLYIIWFENKSQNSSILAFSSGARGCSGATRNGTSVGARGCTNGWMYSDLNENLRFVMKIHLIALGKCVCISACKGNGGLVPWWGKQSHLHIFVSLFSQNLTDSCGIHWIFQCVLLWLLLLQLFARLWWKMLDFNPI